MITDLRTGGLAGGSGEQAQANTMVLQVLRHLMFPVPSSRAQQAADMSITKQAMKKHWAFRPPFPQVPIW
jgi:trimethylamine:corrinoid methyltransferase-like protein